MQFFIGFIIVAALSAGIYYGRQYLEARSASRKGAIGKVGGGGGGPQPK